MSAVEPLVDGGGYLVAVADIFQRVKTRYPHGRGIALARLSSFDALEYVGKGNEVVATVKKRLDG